MSGAGGWTLASIAAPALPPGPAMLPDAESEALGPVDDPVRFGLLDEPQAASATKAIAETAVSGLVSRIVTTPCGWRRGAGGRASARGSSVTDPSGCVSPCPDVPRTPLRRRDARV